MLLPLFPSRILNKNGQMLPGKLSNEPSPPLVLLKHSIAYATPSVPVRLPGKRQANGLPDEFAAFSETLRNEVDLNRLREQLVEVVQETMEPAHISLWLRKPESFDARKTRVLPAIGDYWGEQ